MARKKTSKPTAAPEEGSDAAESIDGAVRTITEPRRKALGAQLAHETIKLQKLTIESSQVAAGWRKKITNQTERCRELAMALEIGKEQVDTRGEFVRAPQGSQDQLDIPAPAKRGRQASGDDEDDDGDGD